MEAVFYAQNFKSAFNLGAVRGVIILAAQSCGVPVFEYSTTAIKLAVAGFGRASKQAVQRMVKVILRLERLPASDDASDALAAAICHTSLAKIQAATQGAQKPAATHARHNTAGR